MIIRNRTAFNWSLLIVITICVVGVSLAQSPEARVKGGWDLKGSIGFEKSYSPQKGDQALLKGVPLVLKDKKTGAVLGRTTTDADGKFTFTNIAVAGSNPMMNARQVCNEKGDCFDFQPLKPDDPPPIGPIIVDDPPLQPMKRVNRATPKLYFREFTCTTQGGGTPMRLRAVKGESLMK